MNQPPLNPDALEAASREVFREVLGFTKTQSARVARRAVSAYLAAALPEVTSVEELEALPAGSIVSSGGREFYKTSYIEYPWILPYGVDRFGSEYLAKHSKVTVMHLPEFES